MVAAAVVVIALLAFGGSAVDTHGARVVRFTIDSRFVHQALPVTAVLPAGRASGEPPLLVFLHGKRRGRSTTPRTSPATM